MGYISKAPRFDNIYTKSNTLQEYIRNEGSSSRLIHRYDGKISDHIESILKSGERSLKTKKKCDIESTSNDYNFLCNGRKQYYILN